MIEELTIQGFKRFTENKFALKSLTVLAGKNGAGKTSVLHALILLREALRSGDVVPLSGICGLDLGDFQDVLNVEADEIFKIGVSGHNNKVVCAFLEGDTPHYSRVQISGEGKELSLYKHSRFFQYLAAERNGPRITQPAAATPAQDMEVGHYGQYSAHLLEELGGKEVIEEARRSSLADPSLTLLKDQTEAWLSRLTTPLQINTEKFFGTGVIALQYRVAENWVRPTNMGFGITFALPIVLAGLTVKNGGLLLIENPEAHLHPAGQAQLGLFIGQMAASGVQVIIETHSDHVINGIRRAVGEEKRLSADQTIVHYFEESSKPPVELHFTSEGGMSDWPTGFFDQYQIDIAALTKARFLKR